MNVRQLAEVKRWHVLHRERRPVELHAWDTVLTLWPIGWMGVIPALVLHEAFGVALCVALFYAPPAYVWLRRRLHRQGRLRCDWIDSVPPD
jgi:hypothetical protein